jgi:hypothetical protein
VAWASDYCFDALIVCDSAKGAPLFNEAQLRVKVLCIESVFPVSTALVILFESVQTVPLLTVCVNVINTVVPGTSATDPMTVPAEEQPVPPLSWYVPEKSPWFCALINIENVQEPEVPSPDDVSVPVQEPTKFG